MLVEFSLASVGAANVNVARVIHVYARRLDSLRRYSAAMSFDVGACRKVSVHKRVCGGAQARPCFTNTKKTVVTRTKTDWLRIRVHAYRLVPMIIPVFSTTLLPLRAAPLRGVPRRATPRSASARLAIR